MGVPYVKKYHEERELNVVLAIDVSPSAWFGSVETSKRELAANVAALLAVAALRVNDRVALVLFGDRIPAARLIDLSVTGAIASAVAFWILPPPLAALLALPSIGLSLSVFVPLLLYLIPRRVGRAAAPHVIGYLVAAGMIGGAVLPAGIGVVMQSTGVASLGVCLAALAATFGGLHLAARGR
jgi:fucose permease